jgi:hypothetical protein
MLPCGCHACPGYLSYPPFIARYKNLNLGELHLFHQQ